MIVILSQDGMRLIHATEIVVEDKSAQIVIYPGRNNIGIYLSRSRCIEIVEEIRQAVANEAKTFVMPKE